MAWTWLRKRRRRYAAPDEVEAKTAGSESSLASVVRRNEAAYAALRASIDELLVARNRYAGSVDECLRVAFNEAPPPDIPDNLQRLLEQFKDKVG